MSFFSRGPGSLPPYVQVLKSIPMFSKLTPQEFRIVAQIAHERSYMAGEIVFEQGDEGLGMYVVLEGRIRIHQACPEGRTEDIAQVEAGAYFGELALLDGAPRSASATAAEPTRLLFFFRPEFMDILETHGRLGAKLSLEIARHTAERLRRTVVCRESS
jgi:CRP-like cAMP-binding protein